MHCFYILIFHYWLMYISSLLWLFTALPLVRAGQMDWGLSASWCAVRWLLMFVEEVSCFKTYNAMAIQHGVCSVFCGSTVIVWFCVRHSSECLGVCGFPSVTQGSPVKREECKWPVRTWRLKRTRCEWSAHMPSPTQTPGPGVHLGSTASDTEQRMLKDCADSVCRPRCLGARFV